MTVIEYDPDYWQVEDPDNALVLIACSGMKATRPAPAREFYAGALFQVSVRWAESWSFRWMVLSALHGLIAPDTVVEPYDARLTATGTLADDWVGSLRGQLLGDVTSVVVLGGQAYVDAARAAWPDLAWWAPLQELPERGYGHYRQWLLRNTAAVSA
jgi:hypothetical protein